MPTPQDRYLEITERIEELFRAHASLSAYYQIEYRMKVNLQAADSVPLVAAYSLYELLNEGIEYWKEYAQEPDKFVSLFDEVKAKLLLVIYDLEKEIKDSNEYRFYKPESA